VDDAVHGGEGGVPAPAVARRHRANAPADAMARLEWVTQRLARALQRAAELVAADHGITVAEYHLLLANSDDVGRSNAEIARLIFVTPQSANRVLAELERRGYLERTDDPHHGRIRQTVLTPAGREVLDQCIRQIADIEARVMQALDDDQQRVLLPALLQAADTLAGGYFGDPGEELRAEAYRRARHAAGVEAG
jgi:DNA-binding MarR family transcriptional regulator